MLKLLAGNPGRRALNEDEPMPEGDLHESPPELSARQVTIWKSAIENTPRGLLRHLDGSLLRTWVVACSRYEEAEAMLQKYGMVIKSPEKGIPIQSPYMAILNRQALIMMKAGAELGFSPSARTRISSPSSQTNKNRFQKFKR